MDKDTQNLLLIALVIGVAIFLTHRISNKEEWEIVRDPSGKLQKIIIHRDVKNNLK